MRHQTNRGMAVAERKRTEILPEPRSVKKRFPIPAYRTSAAEAKQMETNAAQPKTSKRKHICQLLFESMEAAQVMGSS